jgi:hypothetical protein
MGKEIIRRKNPGTMLMAGLRIEQRGIELGEKQD